MNSVEVQSNKKLYKIVQIISIAIPIAVAFLIGIRYKIDLGSWTKVLPLVNAIINSLTSILLVVGFVAIKGKNKKIHQWSMIGAFALGAVFLVTYILYHISNKSTHFGGEGFVKYLYFFFLISHILLSIIVVRFVLLAMFYAKEQNFVKHKNVVKIAFPIWLYVSITGVIVYLMVSPYYP